MIYDNKYKLFSLSKFFSLFIIDLILLPGFFYYNALLGFELLIVSTLTKMVLSGFSSYITISTSRMKRYGFNNSIYNGKKRIKFNEIRGIEILFKPNISIVSISAIPFLRIFDRKNNTLCKINTDLFKNDYLIKLLKEVLSINKNIQLDQCVKDFLLSNTLYLHEDNYINNLSLRKRSGLLLQIKYFFYIMFKYLLAIILYSLIAFILYKFNSIVGI